MKISNGPRDGITSWIQCLTQESTGLGEQLLTQSHKCNNLPVSVS